MPLLLTAILGNQWARLAIAVGLAFALGLSGGIVKGMNISNAKQWQKHAEALEIASKQKDEMISADAAFMAETEAKLAEKEAILEAKLHESDPSACHLTGDQLGFLRGLATNGGRNGAALPANTGGPRR